MLSPGQMQVLCLVNDFRDFILGHFVEQKCCLAAQALGKLFIGNHQ